MSGYPPLYCKKRAVFIFPICCKKIEMDMGIKVKVIGIEKDGKSDDDDDDDDDDPSCDER